MERGDKHLQYIFLDVVGFTLNRSLEDQAFVIARLNSIVKQSMENFPILEENHLYLPTGDGICIVLDGDPKPFDLSILIATNILSLLEDHSTVKGIEKTQMFNVRIGINSNVDIVIEDINGHTNVAGRGINDAARLMDIADESQIIVGHSMFDTLSQRKKYKTAFRKYRVKIKHGRLIDAYQFIDKDSTFINSSVPSSCETPKPPEPEEEKLPELIALYVVHALLNESSLLKYKGWDYYDARIVLLWNLARDSKEKIHLGRGDEPLLRTYQAGKVSFEGQLEYYHSVDYKLIDDLADVVELKLRPFRDLFETGAGSYSLVNSKGKEKLLKDRPDITELANQGKL